MSHDGEWDVDFFEMPARGSRQGGEHGAQRPTSEHHAQPAVLGITASTSSQSRPGGADWLEYTVEGEFGESFAEVRPAVAEAYRMALSGSRDCFVDVLGARFHVSPRGQKWGNTFFEFKLEYDGIEVCLPRPDHNGSFAAKVRIGSLKLMRSGEWESYQQSLQLLEAVGVMVVATKLYRIDLCVDLPGLDVALFCQAMTERKTITRMRSKVSGHWNDDGTWQGASCGKRETCRVKVYDKARELADSGTMESDFKRQCLIQTRWGRDYESVPRCEFEMRGEWLRTRFPELVSVESVLRSLKSLSEYLTSQYFRVVDSIDRENKNHQRSENIAGWDSVIHAFKLAFEEGCELVKRETKAFVVNAEHAKRRMIGAVKNFLAAVGPQVVTCRTAAYQCLVNVVDNFYGEGLFPEIKSRWEEWRSKCDGELVFEKQDVWPSSRWRVEDQLYSPF